MFERPWLDLCVGLSSLFSFLFLFIQWVNAGGADRFDVNVESDSVGMDFFGPF